jgi:hypothetical protein
MIEQYQAYTGQVPPAATAQSDEASTAANGDEPSDEPDNDAPNDEMESKK